MPIVKLSLLSSSAYLFVLSAVRFPKSTMLTLSDMQLPNYYCPSPLDAPPSLPRSPPPLIALRRPFPLLLLLLLLSSTPTPHNVHLSEPDQVSRITWIERIGSTTPATGCVCVCVCADGPDRGSPDTHLTITYHFFLRGCVCCLVHHTVSYLVASHRSP